MIKIPAEPIAPVGTLGECRQLWYGLEKIGKTTLAAQFPDPLFVMTEPGANFVAVRHVAVKNWRDFTQVLTLLMEGKARWKTLVVDTADNLYTYCRLHVCRRLGIDHPADADYGKGWDILRHEFFTWIHRLSQLPGGLIFISHARVQEIRRRGGATFSRTTTTMGRAEDIVKPLVDIFAYYEFNEVGKRVLHITGDELVSAGHRCVGHFRSFRSIPMGSSPQEAYRNFVAAFENRLVTGKRVGTGGPPIIGPVSKVKQRKP